MKVSNPDRLGLCLSGCSSWAPGLLLRLCQQKPPPAQALGLELLSQVGRTCRGHPKECWGGQGEVSLSPTLTKVPSHPIDYYSMWHMCFLSCLGSVQGWGLSPAPGCTPWHTARAQAGQVTKAEDGGQFLIHFELPAWAGSLLLVTCELD